MASRSVAGGELRRIGVGTLRRGRLLTRALNGRSAGAQSSQQEAQEKDAVVEPKTFVEAPGRVVALGDVHGDLEMTQNSLKMAGVLKLKRDGTPKWVGGHTHVVQVGDIFDRGEEEMECLDLLHDLQGQAEKEGGGLHILLGNHEVLNASGDFRYVNWGAFRETLKYAGGPWGGDEVTEMLRARLTLFAPGGEVAKRLAQHSVCLVVNDTVFAHGGLRPEHVGAGLENLNRSVSLFLRDELRHLPEEERSENQRLLKLAAGGPESVLWDRSLGRLDAYNHLDRLRNCRSLHETLDTVGCSRLVVGHTPQPNGCSPCCDNRVWRIDVGMSRFVQPLACICFAALCLVWD